MLSTSVKGQLHYYLLYSYTEKNSLCFRCLSLLALCSLVYRQRYGYHKRIVSRTKTEMDMNLIVSVTVALLVMNVLTCATQSFLVQEFCEQIYFYIIIRILSGPY